MRQRPRGGREVPWELGYRRPHSEDLGSRSLREGPKERAAEEEPVFSVHRAEWG